MKSGFELSFHQLAKAFWAQLLGACGEQIQDALPAMRRHFRAAQSLRANAAYNTGSVGLGTGICLFALCAHFKVARVAEVGTFIGRSAAAMALGIASHTKEGVIHTCDNSNDCFNSWDDIDCAFVTYPKQSSTDMLRELVARKESIDLFFFDGRIQAADIPLISQLMHEGTIFAFDDFEGIEKGVVNVATLNATLPHHALIEPCADEPIARFGVAHDRSLLAVLFSPQNITFTAQ